jgi:predicted MPP superfamily phosphohydrolase
MRRVLTAVTLWLAACWGVVGVLLAPVVPGGWATIGALALAFLLALVAIVGGRTAGRYPGRFFRLAVQRPFIYALLLLLLCAATAAVAVLVGWPFGVPGAAGRWTLAVVASTAALGGIAGYVGSRRLRLTRLVAEWPDLPEALDGLRVVQISDTHVGPHTSRRYLARVARLVNEARPDLIAVTGDLVDDYAGDVDHYAAGLGALQAPLGVFACPGNHDVYADWPAVHERLRQLPLTVLVNASRVVEHRGGRLVVVGTGDPAGGRAGTSGGAPDVEAALAGVDPDAVVLALAHNPALWPQLSRHGVALTLSGHTHWGQLAVPSRGWSLASPFNTFAMGAYEEGRSLLYVHPGTLYWGIPFRLGARPEVAVVTLRRGGEGASIRADVRRPNRHGD